MNSKINYRCEVCNDNISKEEHDRLNGCCTKCYYGIEDNGGSDYDY